VWVANTVNGEVTRIDPRTGTITQKIPLGGNPVAIASGPHELWVAEAGDKALIRIDAGSGIPTQTVSLADRPSAVAVGYGAVWVASHDAGTVTEIDSRSGRQIATFHVGHGPAALVLGAGSAWVANNLDGTVWRLDPGTSRVVATIAVGSAPIRLAFAKGSLWVANKFSKTVSQIDPHRDTVVRTITTGGRPTSLAVTAGHLWIGTRPSGDAHRGGTLTLLGFRPSSWSIDPAFNHTWYPPPQFGGLAYDTLVTFERTGGPQGLNLVPDLALAIPEPTDSGTSTPFGYGPAFATPTAGVYAHRTSAADSSGSSASVRPVPSATRRSVGAPRALETR
jgi:YVTN family beta-propeller protein